MTQSSENKAYTAMDIERYHTGKMTAQERHALEKAALDDPFLADALEGYSFTPTPSADIARLRERLAQTVEKEQTPIVPLYRRTWLRAAVLIGFVAGASWLAYNTMSPDNTPIALNKENEQQRQSAATARPENASADSTTAAAAAPAIASPSTEKAEEKVVAAPAPQTVQTGTFDDYAFSTKAPAANRQQSRLQTYAKDRLAASAKDQDGKEQPGLFEKTLDTTRGQTATALTDKKALDDFRLNYGTTQPSEYRRKDSLVAGTRTLTGRTGGLTDTISNFNVVMKEEKNSASEVVVLARGTAKKVSAKPQVTVDTLEPAKGWAHFDDYVAGNLKTPDEIKTKKPLSGDVQLSFEVNKQGEPVNIVVTKSLCAQCDEEAIRLLKEGPKWKRNRDRRGSVTIHF